MHSLLLLQLLPLGMPVQFARHAGSSPQICAVAAARPCASATFLQSHFTRCSCPILSAFSRLQVKNIEKIELGRFEMETWYYSPFPPEYRDCKVRAGLGKGACGQSCSTGFLLCSTLPLLFLVSVLV